MIKGKLYTEIISEFESCETKKDRISILQKYDTPRFRNFLNYVLDESVEFDVQIPNYRPALEPAGLNYTYLDNEIPKLYRFIKGHPQRPTGLTPKKQEQLLVVILESLYKDEAEMLCKLIQRKLKIPHLTHKFIKETYN